MACALLGRTPQPTAVREAIAKSIIEAAKAGERDPVALRDGAALSNSNAAWKRAKRRLPPKVSESDE
jgi:hypothetical protein